MRRTFAFLLALLTAVPYASGQSTIPTRSAGLVSDSDEPLSAPRDSLFSLENHAFDFYVRGWLSPRGFNDEGLSERADLGFALGIDVAAFADRLYGASMGLWLLRGNFDVGSRTDIGGLTQTGFFLDVLPSYKVDLDAGSLVGYVGAGVVLQTTRFSIESRDADDSELQIAAGGFEISEKTEGMGFDLCIGGQFVMAGGLGFFAQFRRAVASVANGDRLQAARGQSTLRRSSTQVGVERV